MASIKLIGTGHLASAIAKLYKVFHVNKVDTLTVLTSSNSRVNSSLYGSPIKYFNPEELSKGDIIILAIPATKIIEWVTQNKDLIHSSIIVDCSNLIGNGEKLNSLLQGCDSSVVKAFTKINVFHILDEDYSITETSSEMPLASNDPDALNKVSELIKRLGFVPKPLPSIEASKQMEQQNFSNFNKWHLPILSGFILWLAFGAYAIVERNLLAGHAWFFQLLQNINVAFSSSALCLFAIVYGLGAYALCYQNIKNKSINADDEPLLVKLLNYRKQFGLVAVFNLVAHFTISLLLFGSTYFKYFSDGSGILLTAGISLFCGLLSYLIYSVTSLSSLPSIAQTLGMVEWRTVQSYLGWAAMLLAIAHVGFMGFGSLYFVTAGGYTLPSSFLLSLLSPIVATATKIIAYITHWAQDLFSSYNKSPIEALATDNEITLQKSYKRFGLFKDQANNNTSLELEFITECTL